ncbi:anthocyanidin 3-O-glucosyltransferase-like [Durio zibethinus]|uniref:Glycosyltransferase n=1 Tax=Durio zibethinus TaxID=66656 RepID=A0A6P6AYS1_DURZI|nr:anthocyanidin 3-O-glucosyltransferase-like [Durio zibethinus]
MASEAKELHTVMFPYFAFGHIGPFIQLSNKLSLHGVRISFLTAPGNVSRIKSSFLLSPKIQIIPLQIPPIQGLPPDFHNTSEMTPAMHELLKQALDLMQPQVKIVLSGLKPQFVFFDFFQHWLPELCSQLGIKTLCFSVFSAISGAYLTVPARLIGVEGEKPTVDDLKKPPHGFPETSVTSLKAFQAEDVSYIFKSFDGGPTVYSRVIDCLNSCSAIVIKTCNEMEAPYVDFMKTQFQKQVLLSGPLTPDPPSGVLEEKWADWLGEHPAKSVIFASFGSETFLKDDQINELAIGLELTGLPFFLVLNFPAGVHGQAELERLLPKGFTEAIKGRGVVHTGWVQQQLILAHDSVGCYVCHSGFSSVIEALMNDCQLVLLPFKGDQFLNSKLIAEDMKAAVEVSRREEDGYFSRENIRDPVQTVMVEVDKKPGMSIRENHKKWKDFLLNAEIQGRLFSDLVQEMKAMA